MQELVSVEGQTRARNARNQNFFQIVGDSHYFHPNLSHVQQEKVWKALKEDPKADLNKITDVQDFTQGLFKVEAREESRQERTKEGTSMPAGGNTDTKREPERIEMQMVLEMLNQTILNKQSAQQQQQQQLHSQVAVAPLQQYPQPMAQQPMYAAHQQPWPAPTNTAYNVALRPNEGGKGWTTDPWASGPKGQAMMLQIGKGGEWDINKIGCYSCGEVGNYFPQCPKGKGNSGGKAPDVRDWNNEISKSIENIEKAGGSEMEKQVARLFNQYHCSKHGMKMANDKPFRPCPRMDCPFIHETVGTSLDGVDVTKEHAELLKVKYDESVKKNQDFADKQNLGKGQTKGNPQQAVAVYIAGSPSQAIGLIDQQTAMLSQHQIAQSIQAGQQSPWANYNITIQPPGGKGK